MVKSAKPNEPKSVEARSIFQVCLCHHVRKAARSLTRTFDRALTPCGLNYSQFNMLVVIAALEPVQAPKVAGHMAMDRTTLSRNLKPLKQEGYIESEGGAGRRASIITLTPAGQAILAKGSILWREAQRDLTQQLGTSRAGQLLDILGAPHSIVA
jgi:DNA-binding MarR family transcriptional regulator